MISTKNVANAVGGKTARACDNCIRKRARWYCTADDAFLCQACDSSVHSANSLARRHHRVRLKTSSIKPSSGEPYFDNTDPSWHRGFTRKPRTPRNGKPAARQLLKSDQKSRNIFPLVPEVGVDENSHEENEEEHLLFRVPIFDPFVSELCTSATSDEATANGTGFESKAGLFANHSHDFDSLHGFLSSDMDPAEFAADVESLLGRGHENECFDMEELGFTGGSDDKYCNSFGTERIKVEKDEACDAHAIDADIDMVREQFELNFDDYDSPPSFAAEEDKVGSAENEDDNLRFTERKSKKRKAILRLNCDAVISAWDSQVSPWSNGKRPDFELHDCWPHCMGSCGVHHQHHPHHHQCRQVMGGGIGGSLGGAGDGGREARVSRYKEKRRTRLFSKKIRYEVRKLNAEKRPRMKGRFVKRATFGAAGFQMISNK